MALTHLVDTSVLSRLSQKVVRARLSELAGSIGRAAMTDLEVGFSARTRAEWDRLIRALSGFDLIEIVPTDFERAGQVQRELARRGLKGRKVPDLLIAAAAERSDLALLHYDRDFDHIAAVTGQPCEWIVRRGTID